MTSTHEYSISTDYVVPSATTYVGSGLLGGFNLGTFFFERNKPICVIYTYIYEISMYPIEFMQRHTSTIPFHLIGVEQSVWAQLHRTTYLRSIHMKT